MPYNRNGIRRVISGRGRGRGRRIPPRKVQQNLQHKLQQYNIQGLWIRTPQGFKFDNTLKNLADKFNRGVKMIMSYTRSECKSSTEIVQRVKNRELFPIPVPKDLQ